MANVTENSVVEVKATESNLIEPKPAQTTVVEPKPAQTAKPKAKRTKKAVVKAIGSHSFIVKGPKAQPSVVLVIDGKERPFDLGSRQSFSFGQFKAPEAITALFEGIMAKVGPKQGILDLACKAGYKGAQFGLTKATSGNSWKGYCTLTDGELCWHAWPQKDISLGVLDSIAQSNELRANRRGSNWITLAVTKENLSKAIKACCELLNKAQGN